ncbi:hypothetical protein [Sphingomonas sp.]|uniref:hypothetical protein n=1 Tax=Sphingomonas sp. TaxID=28214 RepID=UPI002EDB7FB9
MTDELARANMTLRRSADFFSFSLARSSAPTSAVQPISHQLRSRVIGNGLRELDRFLNILIDQVASRRHLPTAPGQRNTANKLQAFWSDIGVTSDGHVRLRALGRSRDCLFHCDGIARRADVGNAGVMTLGWPDENGLLQIAPLGSPIIVKPADLQNVRAFYGQLADDLRLAAGPSN